MFGGDASGELNRCLAMLPGMFGRKVRGPVERDVHDRVLGDGLPADAMALVLQEWQSRGLIPIVSTFGDSLTGGGGLFALEPGGVEVIDRISSTGLATNGSMVWRAFRTLGYGGVWLSELVGCDALGLARYLRLDGITDVHDLAIDEGGDVLVVSTGDNRTVRVGADGTVTPVLVGDGTGDAWHLNCVTSTDEGWFATAFGQRAQHRAWARSDRKGEGVLLDMASGERVIGGLVRPHDPRRMGDGWLIAESGADMISRVGDDGAKRTLPLAGWTRGLVIEGNLALVGVSASREGTAEPTGSAVVLVDLDRWQEVGRVEVACEEIYALSLRR